MTHRSLGIGLIAAVVAAVSAVGSAASSHAAPAGAAEGLHVAAETCQADGTITANVRWTPSRLGAQWFDVSAADYFESDYTRAGPYGPRLDEVNLVEVDPGVTYYMRVWTWNGADWLASDTLVYTAGGCEGGGDTPQTDTELQAAPIEQASVSAGAGGAYTLHVVAGLEGGCDEPFSQDVTREGTTVRVEVINQRTVGQPCTLIYSTYELDVDLGSEFQPGVTYAVDVNSTVVSFTAQ